MYNIAILFRLYRDIDDIGYRPYRGSTGRAGQYMCWAIDVLGNRRAGTFLVHGSKQSTGMRGRS